MASRIWKLMKSKNCSTFFLWKFSSITFDFCLAYPSPTCIATIQENWISSGIASLATNIDSLHRAWFLQFLQNSINLTFSMTTVAFVNFVTNIIFSIEILNRNSRFELIEISLVSFLWEVPLSLFESATALLSPWQFFPLKTFLDILYCTKH